MTNNLYLDTRKTGQGKSFSLVNFLLSTNKKVLLINPNISNNSDTITTGLQVLGHNKKLFKQWISFLEVQLDEFKAYKEKLELEIKVSKLSLDALKNKLKATPNLIKEFNKLDKDTLLKVKTLEHDNIKIEEMNAYLLMAKSRGIDDSKKLLQEKRKFIKKHITQVNSFFQSEKFYLDGTKENNEPALLVPTFYGASNYFLYKTEYEKFEDDALISKGHYGESHFEKIVYDYIIIDEADKTLGSLTLKQIPEDLTYYNVENIKDIYKNKELLEEAKSILGEFEYKEEKYIRNAFVIDDKNVGFIYKISNFCKKNNLELKKITEYASSYRTKQYGDEPYWSGKLLQRDNKKFNFIEVKELAEYVKDSLAYSGEVVVSSATSTPILESFISHFKVVGGLPYSHEIYHKPISYKIIKGYPNSTDNIFTVLPKQSDVKGKDCNNTFYFNATTLRGSNDFGSKFDGVFLNFKLDDVKQPPNHARLPFYAKIGNSFLETLDDIEVAEKQGNYYSHYQKYVEVVKNATKQIVGRLNRGKPFKVIYYIDDNVGLLVKDYIKNQLKQNII